MNKNVILSEVERLLDRYGTGLLATVDEGGTPSLRWMTPFFLKNSPGILYALTVADSRKVGHIKLHPQVQWLFQPPSLGKMITLSINADPIVNVRRELKESRKLSLSFNAFLIKMAAEALKKNHRVNASWGGAGILQFGSIDIGLAVALEDGLITPVVRGCGNKGIEAIDGELKELITNAREGRLPPAEYTGATFTISNLGSFGIEEFTAIINPPGSAILAVGAVMPTLSLGEGGELVTTSVMKMTLSCDHRVIDGAVGARFMKDLKDIIENPIHALL